MTNETGVLQKPSDSSKKSMSRGMKIGLGLCGCLLLTAIVIGVAIFFFYAGQKSLEKTAPTSTAIATETAAPTSSPTNSLTPTPTTTTQTRTGWQRYENSRYKFSLEVPSTLIKEESANSDGATFTTHDPPMTVRVWAENNSLNLTAQQAIDFDKEDFAKNEAENFTTLEEEQIKMDSQSAVRSVWSYSSPETGDAITAAKAYTAKGGNIYKLEFLIDYSAWAEYSQMFDEIVASFQFE